MNLWKKISYLGIRSNMPIALQKGIIMYNRLARIGILVIGINIVLLFSVADLYLAPLFLSFIPLLLAFGLFLNKRGKVTISVLLISYLIPPYILFVSVFSKVHGQAGLLVYMIIPRFGMMLLALLPLIIFGFINIKKGLGGAAMGIICFLLFDFIHRLFGIAPENLLFDYSQYRILIYGAGTIFLVFILMIFFLQNVNSTYEVLVNKQKKEIAAQRDSLAKRNEEVLQQNDEIQAQRDEIERQHKLTIRQRDRIAAQHKEITASISYAKRIQQALLPPPCRLNDFFADSFVFWHPRDVVSGDFYWMHGVTPTEKDRKPENSPYIVVTVADCTGHGVPGAFMSMLGVSFLNETIIRRNIIKPAVILNELRDEIKQALQQTGKSGEQKDGMDIALLTIDIENKKLQFAGAHNPLYLIRDANRVEQDFKDYNNNRVKFTKYSDKVLCQFKADTQPVGIHLKERPFTSHTFNLLTGDVIYLFSDGFYDQCGGTEGKKYKTRQFKQKLLEIHTMPMQKQKAELTDTLHNWMNPTNNQTTYEQVDDILIMGIKI